MSEKVLATEDGLRAAYAEHSAELYRFALRSYDDEAAAQDLVQEVFLRAWRSSSGYDPSIASLRVWLFAIARNVAVDAARRRSVRPVSAPLVEAHEPVAPDEVDGLLRRWTVDEALRRIGAEHRAALVETYLKGRPYAEVAAEMSIPVGTLRSRVFYGLKALRNALDEMGVTG